MFAIMTCLWFCLYSGKANGSSLIAGMTSILITSSLLVIISR